MISGRDVGKPPYPCGSRVSCPSAVPSWLCLKLGTIMAAFRCPERNNGIIELPAGAPTFSDDGFSRSLAR